MSAFKPGDKAVWWNGPGGQSRAEVTILEVDGDEYLIETPIHMYRRYETVRASTLEPLVSETDTPMSEVGGTFPEGLCGIEGCVYTKDHQTREGKHSWQK